MRANGNHNGNGSNNKRYYALLGLFAYLALVLMIIVVSIWGH